MLHNDYITNKPVQGKAKANAKEKAGHRWLAVVTGSVVSELSRATRSGGGELPVSSDELRALALAANQRGRASDRR